MPAERLNMGDGALRRRQRYDTQLKRAALCPSSPYFGSGPGHVKQLGYFLVRDEEGRRRAFRGLAAVRMAEPVITPEGSTIYFTYEQVNISPE
jgi:hypothetical protein